MAKLNTSELADHYGKHRQTIMAWVRQGMPYVKKGGKGKEWVFDSAAVAEWREEQAVLDATGNVEQATEDELRRRKLAAEATKIEIEVAQVKKQLAPVADMERAVGMAYAEVRSRIRTLPSRVVAALIGETDESVFKSVLLAEIDQALEALADSRLVDESDLDDECGADV